MKKGVNLIYDYIRFIIIAIKIDATNYATPVD